MYGDFETQVTGSGMVACKTQVAGSGMMACKTRVAGNGMVACKSRWPHTDFTQLFPVNLRKGACLPLQSQR